ncbi:MAG: hypothetical protein CVU97_06745 [Firmicutes bacterium HGW-Firmicutes-21]|nr:MAG: hypothetical protein CVU97_06745 [Firmicutes bacterium HGW-Firmicutes-21]
MNINIADNLKRLRKKREITQEDLANFIGVSFQAVSKWERNEGYPDITILPVIANFFDVSLDELVGMDEIKNSTRLEAVFTQLKENASVGNIEKNITLLREEIKHFPNDYNLLLKLAHYLIYCNTDKETQLNNNMESLKINKRILEFCTDDKLRVSAQESICYNYFSMNDYENAAKEARKLPNLFNSKELTIAPFLKGTELIKECQNTITLLAGAIDNTLRIIADANCGEGLNWTNEERIAILDKGNQIYKIIYDKGDYHFVNVYLSGTYCVMAALSLLDGKKEQALDYLEKAVYHAIEFDTLPPKAKYTSLLVNSLEYDVLVTSKNYSHSWSKETLDKLKQDRYDVFRSDKRFIELIEKLNQHIGENN